MKKAAFFGIVALGTGIDTAMFVLFIYAMRLAKSEWSGSPWLAANIAFAALALLIGVLIFVFLVGNFVYSIAQEFFDESGLQPGGEFAAHPGSAHG